MELNLQNILSKIIIAFPFGIGAVVFIIFGIKRFERFFLMNYQENPKEKFKDNLIGNLYIALFAVCFIPLVSLFVEDKFVWGILPVSLWLGILILPIGIVGAYWQSYMRNKLWGGFIPTVRENYGYAQPESTIQRTIDISKIKIPRSTMLIAFSVALLFFLGFNLLLYLLGLDFSGLSGIFYRWVIPGGMAYGIFVLITTAAMSRRIQKLKDEMAHEDNNT